MKDYDPHEEEDYSDFTVDFKPAHWIVGVPVGILTAIIIVFGVYRLITML